MRLSFAELWEQMVSDPLMDSGEETEAMGAVRAGLNLRKDEERSFWDDFMDVCGNPSGLSELLGVRPEQVSGWPAKIREVLENVEKHDAEHPESEPDREMLPTGATGAVEIPNNSDPMMRGMR